MNSRGLDLASEETLALLARRFEAFFALLNTQEAKTRQLHQQLMEQLQAPPVDAKALARYDTLTPDEVKALVVDHKWMAALDAAVHGELDRVSQALTGRVKELAERYGRTMPALAQQVDELEARVAGHLAKMGFAWN